MNLLKKEANKMPQGPPRKYLTYEQAKNYLSNFAFKTVQEYKLYIEEKKIDFLPLRPASIYARFAYKPHEFLGLDEASYKANVKKDRIDKCIMMKTRPRPSKYNLTKKTTPATKPMPQIVTVVKEVPTGLDPDKVISFLIKEDVSPDTIVNMVAELDIKSSTLMNDLCKYMQERSKRQQVTWRPSGYQTAEAEFAKVG